ncbi:MAG TPA: T9SS type A sorting domain-containing protein [Bacteroidia bacterium]
MKKFITILLALLCLSTKAQYYEWAKSIGGGFDDIAYSITTDVSGNVYLTGYFSGASVDFNPSPLAADTAYLSSIGGAGNTDIFFAKYDSNGNYLWAKSVHGTSNDKGRSIGVDASGNVYITGVFNGTADFNPSPLVEDTAYLASVGTSVFFAKYDTNGDYIWAKMVAENSGNPNDAEGIYSITLDAADNVYLAGVFYSASPIDFNPSPLVADTAYLNSNSSWQAFFAKYDNNGNYIWAKNLNGVTSSPYSSPYSLSVDASGNVYIAGTYIGTVDFDPSPLVADTAYLQSIAGYYDLFFAKYDSNGNYAWSKSIGGISAIAMEIAKGVTLDASGNVYITGYYSDTTDFDPSPLSADTAYLIPSIGGYVDIFFAKYDNNGNYLWAKSIVGVGSDMGNAITLDGSGNVYITGYFGEGADFNPSPADTAYLNGLPGGYHKMFFAKYDTNGNYVWAKSSDGNYSSDISGNSIVVDAAENVYIAGSFWGYLDADPGLCNEVFTGLATDLFFAKYTPTDNNTNYQNITGHVTTPLPANVDNGLVYAFKHQPGSAGLDTVDFVLLDAGGNYNFIALEPDSYLIKVIADETDFPIAVPTYYGTAFQWDSALVFSHGCLQTDTADIQVIEMDTLTGSAAISGFIIEGQGFGTARVYAGNHPPNIPFAPGGPLKGIDVKLGKNPGGGIQARTSSDSTGFYHFDNIPVGGYKIYVDIPNLPMDSTRQIDIIGADISEQNNYYADSMSIYVLDTMIVGIKQLKTEDDQFMIYPNPASERVVIKTTSSRVFVTDLLGKLVSVTQVMNGNTTLDVSSLDNGIYFVVPEKGRARKFTVQH